MRTIRQFKGLSNTSDPMRKGLGWLSVADNVNVTNTGALSKREGYTKVKTGNFSGVFTTFDFQRMYAVLDDQLIKFDGTVLATLASAAPMYWAEINDQVFFNNGTDSGIIRQDGSVIPWRWPVPTAPSVTAATGNLPAGTYQVRCTYVLDDGRETGTGEAAEIVLTDESCLQISDIPRELAKYTNVYIAPANSTVYQLYAMTRASALTFNSSPDDLGRDLLNAFFDPLPLGTDVIQIWKARAYAAQYMPSDGQTAVWFSEPLAFHLFNLNSNFILVPGKVQMLAAHNEALLIGTTTRVYAYDGQSLKQLAEYGVIPGQHWSRDDERILFWTERGLCAALPFQNLTEKQVSVAPGVRAGGCVVRYGGQKRFLVALQQGGQPFNSYN